MGDERADRGGDGVDGDPDDGRDGDRPRSMVVTELRRENRRLRERLDRQTREHERIVDRYEALLDEARSGDGSDGDDGHRSTIGRLFHRLRRT